ncbi:jg22232 [Pararge aegeria aegeria]|uniref:Jg22232 protein n=1 Tax=Pararge aegeria aegeria TaxID=348720 RepID=A0A8S4SQV5_9NEOP|nr:jg22232 [Pararge aegeria aegeria]
MSTGLIRRLRVTQRAKELCQKYLYVIKSEMRRSVDSSTSPVRVLELQPRTGKRSIGRPPTRWTDDIKRVVGSRWIQAQHREVWNATKDLCPAVDVNRLI